MEYQEGTRIPWHSGIIPLFMKEERITKQLVHFEVT
jgi:hypothetical protein